MNEKAIDFLLAPDGPSSRRARRALARQAPGLYRMAGSWPELMTQARSAYLLPPEDNAWAEKLAECAFQQTDGFWVASLNVAPQETLAELDAALTRLVQGAGPDGDWTVMLSQLPDSSRCRFPPLPATWPVGSHRNPARSLSTDVRPAGHESRTAAAHSGLPHARIP